MKMGVSVCFLVILLFALILLHGSGADPVEDKQALLEFLQNMPHSRSLNWYDSSTVCGSWTGVTCSNDSSRIIAVRLPGVGFYGPIPSNTLSRLSALQILSLRSNAISGPIPSDFSKLGNLTALYLQFNHFSGPLPSDFAVWKNLVAINFSNNAFNGSIPSSISNLTLLTALNLANNHLSGVIPDLYLPNLQVLDLSNNNLTGIVPPSLHHFPSSAFVGNNVSYDTIPSSLAPILAPYAQPSKKWGKLGESAILGILLGGCVLVFAAIGFFIIFCCSNNKGEDGPSSKSKKVEKTVNKDVSGNQDLNSKLTFFEGCSLAFDLEDLLRASAEVLGKGTFAMTYRAALEDSNTVVVKRLKEGHVTKREYEQQMELVGGIKHENVAALRAYYYSKEEKLMMYDYYSQGSAFALLHANRREGRTPLDWETRLKIAIGAARGIAQIHTENNGKLVHGNIKASNVFINPQGYGCVSDLGLATLMSPIPHAVMRTAGYRAPEITDTRKASQASDVYSYGVLLLELLTGKSPTHAGSGDEVLHLVRWVQSVVREEWTAEVFDLELLRYPNIEEEMVDMLQIGLSCTARMPDQRPKMADVVKRVEDIRRINTGNRPSTDTKSEISTATATPIAAAEIGSSSNTK